MKNRGKIDKEARCAFGCGGSATIEETKETELDVNAITLAELQQFNSNLLETDNEISPMNYE